MKTVYVIELGCTEYKSVWDLQRRLFELRLNGKISDVFLLTEHQHVYTLGKSSDEAHLLASESELRSTSADVYRIDRGGDITYHGPGQLVGYPILDLNNYYLDLHRYLRDLEEIIIRTLSDFGIGGHRENNYTGVWVGSDKIAAIGVKINRWVTMHGFALNVNTDLAYFDRIIPCGIFHKGVTSMERLFERIVPISDVINSLTSHFSEVFAVEVVKQNQYEFIQLINQLSNETVECQQ